MHDIISARIRKGVLKLDDYLETELIILKNQSFGWFYAIGGHVYHVAAKTFTRRKMFDICKTIADEYDLECMLSKGKIILKSTKVQK